MSFLDISEEIRQLGADAEKAAFIFSRYFVWSVAYALHIAQRCNES